MNAIFDASAIYNTILLFGSKCYEKFHKNYTTSLAIYELGNIAWKHLIRGNLSHQDASDIIAIVEKLPSVLTVIPLEMNDISNVFSMAASTGITFYDASYVYHAKQRDLELITDDAKLEKIAKTVVPVRTTKSLQ